MKSIIKCLKIKANSSLIFWACFVVEEIIDILCLNHFFSIIKGLLNFLDIFIKEYQILFHIKFIFLPELK